MQWQTPANIAMNVRWWAWLNIFTLLIPSRHNVGNPISLMTSSCLFLCVKLQNLEGKGCYLLVLTVFVGLYFYDYVSSSHRHSTTTSAFYNSNPGMNNWSTISNQIQRSLDRDSLAWIQVKIEIEICEGNMPPADCWELKCWLLIITLLKTLEIE